MNNHKLVAQFYVAGVQHRPYDVAALDIRPQERLDLVPEPDNEYDPGAIMVARGGNGAHLGYVPKVWNHALKIGLDRCIVKGFNREAKPWKMLFVEIWRPDEPTKPTD